MLFVTNFVRLVPYPDFLSCWIRIRQKSMWIHSPSVDTAHVMFLMAFWIMFYVTHSHIMCTATVFSV